MLRLAEIMTRDVVTVTPETPLRDVVELFTVNHISGAPVVSGHDVVGVISAADILAFAAPWPKTERVEIDAPSWDEIAGPDSTLESDIGSPDVYYTDLLSEDARDVADVMDVTSGGRSELADYVVDDVMSREAITLTPNDTLTAAAEVMLRRGIHRVVVVDDGKLVGIVSALDVARAVAEHKLTTRTYVFNDDRDFDERAQPD